MLKKILYGVGMFIVVAISVGVSRQIVTTITTPSTSSAQPLPAFDLTEFGGAPTLRPGWVSIFGNDDMKLYVDRSTIRKDGYKAKMWALFDAKKLDPVHNGFAGLSMVVQEEFDCKNELIRDITHTDYQGSMGKGGAVGSGDYAYKWKPTFPNSFGRAQWNVACGM